MVNLANVAGIGISQFAARDRENRAAALDERKLAFSEKQQLLAVETARTKLAEEARKGLLSGVDKIVSEFATLKKEGAFDGMEPAQVTNAISVSEGFIRNRFAPLIDSGVVTQADLEESLSRFKQVAELTPIVAESKQAEVSAETSARIAGLRQLAGQLSEAKAALDENPQDEEAASLVAALSKEIGTVGSTEFERLIQDLPEQEQDIFKEARLRFLTTQVGLKFTRGEDGTITLTQGPLGEDVPPARQQENRLEAQSIAFLADDIRNLVAAAKRGDINLGLTGTVQRGAIEAGRIFRDIGRTVPVLRGIDERASQTVSDLLGDSAGEFRAAVRDNPTLGELSPFETALGVAMARLNQPTGRLLKDVIDRSLKDARLTGLRSPEQVIERLEFMLERLERRQEMLNREGATTEQREAPGAPLGGDTELRVVLDPNAPGGFRLEPQ